MADQSSSLASNDASSAPISIETPAVFEPLLDAARYKGAYGGRGSGKSHFFAELLVEECLRFPGLNAVCIREVQKDLRHSAKKLIEGKIEKLGVGSLFGIQNAEIKTPGGGVILFQGMQDHTAESIKSLEGMNRCWVEEAQTLSEKSWRMLRPTIREPGSEIWASWNPRFERDPVNKFFRVDKHDGDRVQSVLANWRDNPWFPKELADDRADDLGNDPESCPHVWEGEYVSILKGAYYGDGLRDAERDGRICFAAIDPNIRIHAHWDIGGPGKKADAMTIVISQWVGREIRILEGIEGQGQVLGYYLNELRERGWDGQRKPFMVVPHDAAQTHADNPIGIDFEAQLRAAGYQTKKLHSPPGIVMQRIQTAKRLFPRMVFNKEKTEGLRGALGWYHEKRDEKEGRNVGLGPDHDWSSHYADAFGLMAIDYKEPTLTINREVMRPKYGTMA
jgi:phage terminase large subunit